MRTLKNLQKIEAMFKQQVSTGTACRAVHLHFSDFESARAVYEEIKTIEDKDFSLELLAQHVTMFYSKTADYYRANIILDFLVENFDFNNLPVQIGVSYPEPSNALSGSAPTSNHFIHANIDLANRSTLKLDCSDFIKQVDELQLDNFTKRVNSPTKLHDKKEVARRLTELDDLENAILTYINTTSQNRLAATSSNVTIASKALAALLEKRDLLQKALTFAHREDSITGVDQRRLDSSYIQFFDKDSKDSERPTRERSKSFSSFTGL